MNKGNKRVPVLIIGGGITGLTASLFLLQQGITPMLIERHSNTAIHPRSRGFDIRAMELLRELGLSEQIREAGKALGPAWGILRGKNLKDTLGPRPVEENKVTFPSQMKGLQQLSKLTPEAGARCTQDLAEPILLAAAVDRGADIRFYHQLESLEYDNHGAVASIRDRETGELQTVYADYIIAADGAKSPVRNQLAIPTSGRGAIADFLNIYFEADLAEFVRGREFSLFLIDEPGLTGFLTSINNTNHWVFQLKYDPAQGEKPADFDEARIIAILLKIIGFPDASIRILNILPWQLTVNVATKMQHGRVFLAGDAAHTMTPYGGKGATAGMQDAQNLAWKLGMVVRGYAGASLLDTYDDERQAIGAFYAVRSGNMADAKGLVKEEEVLKGMKNFIGLPDYRYDSKAIVGGVVSVEAEASMEAGLGQPGTRVPHIWLNDEGTKSTLDLVKGNFLLIIFEASVSAWSQQLVNVRGGATINLYAFSADPVGRQWGEISGMDVQDAMLVRPDGFIAWRGSLNDSNENLGAIIRRILTLNAGE